MNWHLKQFEDKDIVFVGAGQGRAMNGLQHFIESHIHIGSFTGINKQPTNNQSLSFLTSYDSENTIFIKNEAIPPAEMPVSYITPMQLFFALMQPKKVKIIGITGTKGKSTTAALTAHVLQAAGKKVGLAGNIGISPFTLIDDADEQTIVVLELSSYQLVDLLVSPNISACINLYNDHADWHGSSSTYWEAKHNIMRYAKPDDLFIYNPTFSALNHWAEQADCRTLAIDPLETLDLSHAQLFGEHNKLNALVVHAITQELSISDGTFSNAVNTFVPLEHRMELVSIKKGITYIDDAIGMTPESTIASMKAIRDKFGEIGCLLLGGQDRNYNFGHLMQLTADYNIPNLVLFPNTIEKMTADIPQGYHPKILQTTSMTEAVQFAANNCLNGTVALLSTAAPSYLLWKDFEEKGDQFKSAVSTL